MENIQIDAYTGDYFVPAVDFNAETGICEISGESLLEDTINFYKPLLSWLEEYTTVLKKPLVFNFKLTYFNTSSSKRILDILHIFREYQNEGGDVKVFWYLDFDSELVEDVEDYQVISKVDIEVIETDDL
jgi:hypothetical protein